MSFVEEGLFKFSVELHKTIELYKENANDNYFVSPFLVSTCLSALLYGSTDNTALEISEALFGKALSGNELSEVNRKLNELIEKAVKSNAKVINTANIIYAKGNYGFMPDFQKNAESSLSVLCRKLEGSSIKTDISQLTNGLVDNCNASISSQNGLVLANAMYVKGIWKLQFNPSDVKTDQFKTASGEQVDVEMMFESNKYRTSYNDELKCNCIELLYEASNIVMIILKPYTNSSIDELGFNLEASLVTDVINSMTQPIKTDLYLPKFKLQTNMNLANILDKLNIKDMFSGDDAKLSAVINHSNGLAVTDVIQHITIEIDEEGVSQEMPTAHQFKPKEFRLNRPFMVMLVSRLTPESSIILFTGAVNNPNK